MARMKDLVMDIQEMIINTEKSFQEIAEYFNAPIEIVYDVAEDLDKFDL